MADSCFVSQFIYCYLQLKRQLLNYVFMEIICDYREKHVMSGLQKIIQNKYKEVQIKTENLFLGDFKIGNMIFERKTHQDLASSILDGRYQEQSNRLKEHATENPSLKIIYIIEGNLDLYFNAHKIDKDKIISCIMSLFYEKGFQILMTKHLNETCDFLTKFCVKYHTKYANGIQENVICVAPKKKNTQINRENIGVLMLCNIPNISAHVAIQLLSPFNQDILSFLQKIKEDPEYLSNIKITSRDNKPRKLGKNIICKLLEYFGDIPIP